MAGSVATQKHHSHFSIENILRKEERKVEPCKITSEFSFQEKEYPSALDRWKNELFSECKIDCCSSKKRDELPILESRHRLTENWLYDNHLHRARNLPTLRAFPPPLPAKRSLYSSSSDIDLTPSPSPTRSTWSQSPPHSKRHSFDYWYLDRPSLSSYSSHHPRQMVDHSLPMHHFYWNSPSNLLEERDAFSAGILGRHRMKSSLTMDDDGSDEGNRKGGQVRFTHTQSTELERVFSLQKYVSPQERKQLARSIDLSERQVKTWFQNRRAKWRRIKLEEEMRARMGNENSSNTATNNQVLNDTYDSRNSIRTENTATIHSRESSIESKHGNGDEYRYRKLEDDRMC